MGLLDGKVAVVTGAARGIGREEALLLAKEGAAVIVNARRHPGIPDADSGAQQVVDHIRSSGGDAISVLADVATWDGAQEVISRSVEEFGQIDILVNNAGVLMDGPIEQMTEEEWDEVIRVNLKGHFAPCRFVAEYWAKQYASGRKIGGRIINTTSQAGLFGRTGRANYSAAKAAIGTLTIVLARELQPYGATCNAISPRARTRMTAVSAPSFQLLNSDDGFDRWSPRHIAPVVAWLASDGAAHITGQTFVVFGGGVWRISTPSVTARLQFDRPMTIQDLLEGGDSLFAGSSSGCPHGPWSGEYMANPDSLAPGSIRTPD